MAIEVTEKNCGLVLEVTVTVKLTSRDYQYFVPRFERLVKQHGKLRVFFEMIDFHGWEEGALWEDLKLDAKHFSDVDAIAMVGDRQWEKGMSMFCKPFTSAKIRYFDRTGLEEARRWLEGPHPQTVLEAKEEWRNEGNPN